MYSPPCPMYHATARRRYSIFSSCEIPHSDVLLLHPQPGVCLSSRRLLLLPPSSLPPPLRPVDRPTDCRLMLHFSRVGVVLGVCTTVWCAILLRSGSCACIVWLVHDPKILATTDRLSGGRQDEVDGATTAAGFVIAATTTLNQGTCLHKVQTKKRRRQRTGSGRERFSPPLWMVGGWMAGWLEPLCCRSARLLGEVVYG